MSKLIRIALVGTMVLIGGWRVAADDLVSPWWIPGLGPARPTLQGVETTPITPRNATYSVWDRLGPTGPIVSDFAAWGAGVQPSVNYPVMNSQFTGNMIAHTYHDNYMGRTGVAGLSGDIEFLIPNTPRTTDAYKLMQVQVTWLPEAPGFTPSLHVDTPGGIRVESWDVIETVLPDGWMHTTYRAAGFIDVFNQPDWFNPDGEVFMLSGNIFVDQVVIDTVCVPEPGSVALGFVTAVFGAGYVWRRYRQTR